MNLKSILQKANRSMCRKESIDSVDIHDYEVRHANGSTPSNPVRDIELEHIKDAARAYKNFDTLKF